MPGSPRTTEHGTYSMYKRRCRCDPCRTYQNRRNARNRLDRLTNGRLSHGTRSAYDAGCRCIPCRKARRDAYQRYRATLLAARQIAAREEK